MFSTNIIWLFNTVIINIITFSIDCRKIIIINVINCLYVAICDICKILIWYFIRKNILKLILLVLDCLFIFIILKYFVVIILLWMIWMSWFSLFYINTYSIKIFIVCWVFNILNIILLIHFVMSIIWFIYKVADSLIIKILCKRRLLVNIS